MILQVNENVIGELADLWRQGFDDPPEYIDMFLQEFARNSLVFISGEVGHITCAAYLIPCEITGLEKPAYYGYAATVLPSERRHGVFKQVLKEIFDYLRQTDSVLIQVPAPGLEDYYRKIGFTDFSKRKVLYFCKPDGVCNSDASILSITADEYFNMRNSFFSTNGFVKWSRKYVNYAINESEFCNNICCKLKYGSGEYLINAERRDNSLIINECTIPAQSLEQYSGFIMRFFGVEKITAYYPESAPVNAQAQIHALSFGVDYMPGAWLGLTML
ncbi:MAG: GNAT family N-acetyltransferase [Clostridiales bacterium]|nr:GNAT family N-acetyltransferase [Clostridiales bacterium]